MQVSIQDGGLEKFKPVEVKETSDLLRLIETTSYSLGVFANNHRTNKNFIGSHYVGLFY